jgi:hypothetical protein
VGSSCRRKLGRIRRRAKLEEIDVASAEHDAL